MGEKELINWKMLPLFETWFFPSKQRIYFLSLVILNEIIPKTGIRKGKIALDSPKLNRKKITQVKIISLQMTLKL